MAAPNTAEHAPRLNATRARQGRLGRHALWVLIISTILATLALMLAWGMRAGDLAAVEGNQKADTTAEAVAGATAPSMVQQSESTAQPIDSGTH